MYICYLDESGTTDESSSSTHFILLGFAIPASAWKKKDVEISAAKRKYDLENVEVHTGWMLRHYPEQKHIQDFEAMDRSSRKKTVMGIRAMNLGRPRPNNKQKELLKNYRKTLPYVHLTYDERKEFVKSLMSLVGDWEDCRLFGEAHDKKCSSGDKAFEMAFEQIVTRFNRYLSQAAGTMGLIVQDHNETICRKLTAKMRDFHQRGTLWAKIDNIVETPLFVDSQLTSMVQIADLCAYATRRFFEKGEAELFDLIYERFDRHKRKLVGLRHYTGIQNCLCRVCRDHGRY